MRLVEFVTEAGGKFIFGRGGKPGGSHKGRVTRKFRCTSGPRKGRIVAKAATCHAPRNVKASRTLTKTKRSKAPTIKVKSSRTKRANPYSKRLSNINIGYRTQKKKSKGKRI